VSASNFNQAKADTFGHYMMDILNKSALALMTSIGHQTGFFDVIAKLPPSTSEQIASAAELNERYVREMLGALVTGGIVDYEPISKTFKLPPEHAKWLTRTSGASNWASQIQIISILASVEQEIIKCFHKGGGVPYSAFPRIQRLIADHTKARYHEFFLNEILLLVPGLVERLRTGIDVADIGCGSGHIVNLLAKGFPASRFNGYDISHGDINQGREEADKKALSNVRFEVENAATLSMSAEFDLIMAFEAIHIQAQPQSVLRHINKALRRGGTFLMVEFAASSDIGQNSEHPLGPFMYTFSCMHCMSVSLAEGGEGLGAMWGENNTKQMLGEAGFTHIEVRRVPSDIFHNYYFSTF
jgi:ubiquinone/menaquinone biosynthesis C-methylase UbiE